MSRTSKIIGFSVPPAIVREVETLARAERRTKSELFREMVRVYSRYRKQRDRDEDRWIGDVIEQVRAEQLRQPMSVDEMLKESARLARYGAQQAKKSGLKPISADRTIHEHRKARQRA